MKINFKNLIFLGSLYAVQMQVDYAFALICEPAKDSSESYGVDE